MQPNVQSGQSSRGFPHICEQLPNRSRPRRILCEQGPPPGAAIGAQCWRNAALVAYRICAAIIARDRTDFEASLLHGLQVATTMRLLVAEHQRDDSLVVAIELELRDLARRRLKLSCS